MRIFADTRFESLQRIALKRSHLGRFTYDTRSTRVLSNRFDPLYSVLIFRPYSRRIRAHAFRRSLAYDSKATQICLTIKIFFICIGKLF